MLPDEVDKTLRKLGSDGDKVRGTIEREFADYLDAKTDERKKRDLGGTAAVLGAAVLGPATRRLGTRLAEELFSPKQAGEATFESAIKRARERWTGGSRSGADDRSAPGETGAAPGVTSSPAVPPTDSTKKAR
jgi:hypothetical protein